MKTTDSKSNASLSPSSSSEPIGWATLEEYIRLQVQDQVQALLEAEVEEHLGRGRYERRGGQPAGYRNGMGRPRKLSLATGTIEVQRPRLRDIAEHAKLSAQQVYDIIMTARVAQVEEPGTVDAAAEDTGPAASAG